MIAKLVTNQFLNTLFGRLVFQLLKSPVVLSHVFTVQKISSEQSCTEYILHELGGGASQLGFPVSPLKAFSCTLKCVCTEVSMGVVSNLTTLASDFSQATTSLDRIAQLQQELPAEYCMTLPEAPTMTDEEMPERLATQLHIFAMPDILYFT